MSKFGARLTIGLLAALGIILVGVGIREVIQQYAVVQAKYPSSPIEVYRGKDAVIEGVGHVAVGLIPLSLAVLFWIRYGQ